MGPCYEVLARMGRDAPAVSRPCLSPGLELSAGEGGCYFEVVVSGMLKLASVQVLSRLAVRLKPL